MQSAPLPFPLITISGGARDRGVAYGEQARERIDRSLAFYADEVTPALGIGWGELCDQLLRRLDGWRAIDDELIEEIEGIAAGSGHAVAEILALNSRGSFVRAPSGQQRDAANPPDGCTSWVVLPEASADGHVYTGQNWDYLAGIRDTIVLVHIQPDRGPRQLMIVEAGQVGRHGINEAGIALHANGLTARLRDPDALPSPLWRRRILREANFTRAVEAAITPPRAGSVNVLLTHRDGVAIDLETVPNTVRWVYPTHGWLLHTNHYVAGIPTEIADSYTPSASSLVRYARGQELLGAAARKGGIGFAELSAVAADHFADGDGLCSHADASAPPADRWQTVATVITDMTEMVMAISAGPPCQGAFSRIEVETGKVLESDVAVEEPGQVLEESIR